MEEDTRIKDIREGDTTRRTIWTLHHSWTRGPGVVYTALYLYRIEMAIKEYKDPEAVTAKEKKTLFYKLFSMSKREWDMEVKRHQQKLNRRQREYMLSFRKHSDKEKK